MKRAVLLAGLLLAGPASSQDDPGARFGSLGASYAIGAPRPSVKIGETWLDETQCGWRGAILALVLSRHPSYRKLLSQGAFAFPSGDLRVAFPQLAEVDTLDVRIHPNDTSRGLRDDYLGFSDGPGNPVRAAVVRSELPDGIDGDPAAVRGFILRTIEQLSEGIPENDIAIRDVDGPWGPVVEVLVRNQAASTCFPTSWYRQLPPGVSVRTVGVNRYLARAGALIDVALIVTIPKDVPKSERGEHARRRMDEFMGSVSLR
jgi:hypothetical protein